MAAQRFDYAAVRRHIDKFARPVDPDLERYLVPGGFLFGQGDGMEVFKMHGMRRPRPHRIETSCEGGYCGTCITRCLAGDPVHRDSVLSESERKTLVMVCRARSRSPVLVLDI